MLTNKFADSMGDDNLADKIQSAAQWSSRYELDLHLIQSGYNPEQIDAAWQQVKGRTPKNQWLTSTEQKWLAIFAIIWVFSSTFCLVRITPRFHFDDMLGQLSILTLSILNVVLCTNSVLWIFRHYMRGYSPKIAEGMLLSFVTILMTFAGIGFFIGIIMSLIALLG